MVFTSLFFGVAFKTFVETAGLCPHLRFHTINGTYGMDIDTTGEAFHHAQNLCIDVSGAPCQAFRSNFRIYLRARTSDIFVFKSVFLQWEFQFLMQYLPKPKTIVDLGGNCGMTALYFATMYPYAKVIVLEPDRANYDILRLNTAHLKNVFSEMAAIWDTPGFAVIHQAGSGFWSRGVKRNVTNAASHPEAVPQHSLRFLMDKYSLAEIDFLKIDVEGSELDLCRSALDGGLQALCRVRCLTIEVHSRQAKYACKRAFVYAGYKKMGHYGQLDLWCRTNRTYRTNRTGRISSISHAMADMAKTRDILPVPPGLNLTIQPSATLLGNL